METVFSLIAMIGMIGMIGMIAGVVSIILVVISTIKKDGLVKKYLKIMGVGFALFIVAVIVTPGNEEVTVHDIIGDNLGNTYLDISISEERSSEILAEILGEGSVATSIYFQFNKDNYTMITFRINDSYIDGENKIYNYYVTPELEKENKEPYNYYTGSTSKDLTVIEGTRYFVETSDDYSSVTRIYGFDEKNILTIDMLFPAVPGNEKYTFEEFSLLVNENIDNLHSLSSDSMSKLSDDKGVDLKDMHDFMLENMVVKNAKLGFNDTFDFRGIDYTVTDDLSWEKLSNRYTDLNGRDIVKVPVTFTNNNLEKDSLNMFSYKIYGPNGTKLNSVSAYTKGNIDYFGDILPGSTANSFFAVLYDGDGEYQIHFDGFGISDKILYIDIVK